MRIGTRHTLLIVWLGAASSTAIAGNSLVQGSDLPELFNKHYTLVGQRAIVEGDIIVGTIEPQASTAENRRNKGKSVQLRGMAASRGTHLWAGGIVPYEIDSELPDLSVEAIKSAISHWSLASSIKLIERSSLGADLPDDYISFQNGPGCASWVGRQGGEQAIWVSEHCTTGSVMHEIGHALGLLHEHTRADRDQYIVVNHDNIEVGREFNFEKSDTKTNALGAYDYGSIMHYGEHYFSANGHATLIPIAAAPGTVVGQRVTLSNGDLAAIEQLYGSRTDLIPEPTVGQALQAHDDASLMGGGGSAGAILVLIVGASVRRHKKQLQKPQVAV